MQYQTTSPVRGTMSTACKRTRGAVSSTPASAKVGGDAAHRPWRRRSRPSAAAGEQRGSAHSKERSAHREQRAATRSLSYSLTDFIHDSPPTAVRPLVAVAALKGREAGCPIEPRWSWLELAIRLTPAQPFLPSLTCFERLASLACRSSARSVTESSIASTLFRRPGCHLAPYTRRPRA